MFNPLNLISKIFKSDNEKQLKRLKNFVIQINNKEQEIKKIDQNQFLTKTLKLKKRIKEGEKHDQILPEAFALVREAAFRTLKERHFDVQLMGGIILHEGKIAEMKTGEGKNIGLNPASISKCT